ncbi:MAG: aminopeptidase [Gammaproteobacteria bacterium]|nr:aminopeptidase [Gammaproteobacteria bacterium]
MKPIFGHRFASVAIVSGLAVWLSGCYYMQAARGQFEVMRKREPISEVINAEETPVEIADRLRILEQARQFSIDELGLPDNNSYRSFADLERDYVLWNVIAAPEFSLEPKRWCYPVVGCVSYRGYFDEDAARRLGDKLTKDGYDVVVGGVAAYSTLGRFSDPILNTMLHWEDVDLVAVMFHELAHQVVYVKDDTGFNESFATAVEEIGIERWLMDAGRESEVAAYNERRSLQQRLMALVAATRIDLEDIYTLTSDADRRLRKRQRLTQLSGDARLEFEAANRKLPEWWSEDLNNARLATMTLYQGLLPKFHALLAQCTNELECFYTEVEALSQLDKDARDARLKNL